MMIVIRHFAPGSGCQKLSQQLHFTILSVQHQYQTDNFHPFLCFKIQYIVKLNFNPEPYIQGALRNIYYNSKRREPVYHILHGSNYTGNFLLLENSSCHYLLVSSLEQFRSSIEISFNLLPMKFGSCVDKRTCFLTFQRYIVPVFIMVHYHCHSQSLQIFQRTAFCLSQQRSFSSLNCARFN